MNIQALLEGMSKLHASDLHLKVGSPPMLRINGTLRPVDSPPLESKDTEEVVRQMVPPQKRKVFDESDIGEEMYGLVSDKLDVRLLCVMYFGKRHLNLRMPKSERSVMTPADMAGVKLRMPGTDAWQFLGKALGANPTPMAFTEVYTGLQTGAIDGQDNPLPTDKDKKFYEVTSQIILTGHLADMNFLSISNKAWNEFTEEQQAIVDRAAKDSCAKISSDVEQNEAELVQFFKDQGLDVYEPDVEAFRTHAQEMYAGSDFSKDWPEGMVERVNAVK